MLFHDANSVVHKLSAVGVSFPPQWRRHSIGAKGMVVCGGEKKSRGIPSVILSRMATCGSKIWNLSSQLDEFAQGAQNRLQIVGARLALHRQLKTEEMDEAQQ